MSLRVSFLTVLMLATRGCFRTCSPFCCTAEEMFSDRTWGVGGLVQGLEVIGTVMWNLWRIFYSFIHSNYTWDGFAFLSTLGVFNFNFFFNFNLSLKLTYIEKQ